jgi:hypothetical protein
MMIQTLSAINELGGIKYSFKFFSFNLIFIFSNYILFIYLFIFPIVQLQRTYIEQFCFCYELDDDYHIIIKGGIFEITRGVTGTNNYKNRN